MSEMRPCRGVMGRRFPIAGRPCPSRTKHASGLCASHRANEEAKGRARLLRLYRIKFATSDMGSWDAGAHLAAKDALLKMGEPGISFEEACRLGRALS